MGVTNTIKDIDMDKAQHVIDKVMDAMLSNRQHPGIGSYEEWGELYYDKECLDTIRRTLEKNGCDVFITGMGKGCNKMGHNDGYIYADTAYVRIAAHCSDLRILIKKEIKHKKQARKIKRER